MSRLSPLSALAMLLPLTFAAGCQDPFQIDIVNNTGAELLLEWDTVYEMEGQVIHDAVTVPVGGGLIDYTGQPVLNKKTDVSIRAVGMYATGTRELETLTREEIGTLTWTEADITNFRMRITNNGGSHFNELYVKDAGTGTIGLDERPGQNFGPLGAFATVEFSLRAVPEGYDWIAYSDDVIWEGNQPFKGSVAGVDEDITVE